MTLLHLSDANIYYESAGSGKPPLVFIHGFTCDHSDWSFQVKHFSGTKQAVTCDLRGHGQSTGKPEDGTIETLAQDVVALMNSLKLRDAVLIGHSMGCRVALEASIQAPELVAGIVFVDGSQMGRGNPEEAVEKARKTLEKIGFQANARESFGKMFFGNYDVSLKNRIIERAVKLNPEYGISLRSNFIGWDAANI